MANKSEVKKPAAKNNHVVAAGVGLGAAAVAAAGAFFLYGSKNAAKNRKQVKSWALKAKADVLEKLEDAQEMTEKEYADLIKSVSGAYAGAKNASKKDILEFSKEMKDHWKQIEKAAAPLKKSTKAAAKTVKKEVKSAAKDTKTAATKVAKTVKKAVK
jgi:6-phosphogluconolactonase (cycloisomerase 2 family)